MLELVNDSGVGAVLVPGWDRKRHYQWVLVSRLTLNFSLDGHLTVAQPQPAPLLVDMHYGKPGKTSLKSASEIASFKQGAEYYLSGHARPPAPTSQARVGVEIRQQQRHYRKTLVALGEHRWQKGVLGAKRSAPEPFERLPLRYEFAYGGSHEKQGRREKRNPVGRGFNPSGWSLLDERAPQLEYAGRAVASPARSAAVAGFAPMPVFWSPRQARFGTPPDDPLAEQGCPWGADASAFVHHCAPQDQWLERPFQGGESITLNGFFGQRETVALTLPRWAPQALLIARGRAPQRLSSQCDTLVIDTDARQLALVARCPVDPARLNGQPAWLRLEASSRTGHGEGA
ncbi:MAG: DUF2169 domain-containing protein [Alcanivorax sp.]|nr:DUF2169 domain-containing protein [Alcanivorax sp.]